MLFRSPWGSVPTTLELSIAGAPALSMPGVGAPVILFFIIEPAVFNPVLAASIPPPIRDLAAINLLPCVIND